MKLVFNSSLPRSGSTLLQNVLAQNPRFYCSPTSGVLELLYAARQNFTNLDEFKLQDGELMKRAWLGFCRAALQGFYAAITDAEVAVDKSRGWGFYYEWLQAFYPEAKLICCVRDPRALASSMEKLHRKNGHLHDPADAPGKMQFVTVEQRVGHWMNSPPVGLGLQRLRDAILKGHDKSFFFVQHEEFSVNPVPLLKRLYDYLGEPYFNHDFENIEQKVTENDNVHGVYGDHVIRGKLAPVEGDWDAVLGAGLAREIKRQNEWYYERFH